MFSFFQVVEELLLVEVSIQVLQVVFLVAAELVLQGQKRQCVIIIILLKTYGIAQILNFDWLMGNGI